jgi:branched-chain amino acid transport system substrate-binding protein
MGFRPFGLVIMFVTLASPSAAQVKFGSTLTLTGSVAQYGLNARDAMELAKDEVNSQGGINGQYLKIIYEDFGEVDLKRAASAAQKLISIDRVAALLPIVTEDAQVVHPIASRAGIITMAIFAGDANLTKGKSLLYQVSSSDESLIEKLVDYAVAQGKPKLCVLSEESPYGAPLAAYILDYSIALGLTTPAHLEYPAHATDFRSFLAKLRATHCQSLVLIIPPMRQGTALRQMAQLRWRPLILGLETSDDRHVLAEAGTSTEDVVYVKYMRGTSEFKESFKKRFGREAELPAALAYDAVMVLAAAMNKAGTSGKAVAEHMDSIVEFPGASGVIRFKDGTRTERPVELWTIRKGQQMRIE